MERLDILPAVELFRDEKNAPIKMYGVNWDVTERVEKEALLKLANVQLIQSAKLASLGEMSAAIAHEINNPLAIIKGAAELIAGKFKNDTVKISEKIQSIHKSADRIGKIINGLRKFSRSGAMGEFSLHSLENIVTESIGLVSLKAQNSDTTIELECHSKDQIVCNEVEIEQVIVNLISNAIDAAKVQKDKWVKLRVYNLESSVVLEVCDSGSGIPDSIKAKIFDPFFTTKEVGEGTGLGLSISKGILDQHKAQIEILNDVPNTCFRISFAKASS